MTTANLGSFKKTGETFSGTIHSLAWKAQIEIQPIEGAGAEGAPSYRVFHAKREIGAAWVKRARKNDREFLSLKLHDLAFGAAPVYPALVESQTVGTWNLLLNGQRD